ncbi:MAG: rhodanese-like domain-containing protein [Nanoarchaeota archaeon]|nr:rhodanese-like domain-containing protein [Nanoarchaeota archaeon]
MNTISPQQLYEQLGPDLFLCDVREPFEYEEGHISGSVNIPLGQLSQKLKCIPREKTIITICAHGIRSERARQFLSEQGYAALTLVGGMQAWDELS